MTLSPDRPAGPRGSQHFRGGRHHICKQKLLPCRKRLPLTLFVTSEKCKQNDAFGSSRRVGGEVRCSCFLSFKGAEAKAQKGQRA